MAERALRKAGYHIRGGINVYSDKDECVGHIGSVAFTTPSIYESRNNEDDLKALANTVSVKILKSIVNGLGLGLEEVRVGSRDSNFIIKTGLIERMPIAAKTYKKFTEGNYGKHIMDITQKELHSTLQKIYSASEKLRQSIDKKRPMIFQISDKEIESVMKEIEELRIGS